MKYPFVRQDGIKDCGVACLLMIMKFYGGGASKEYLRMLTNTTKDGVDAYSLLEGAKKLNFSTKGLKGNIEDFDLNDLPCIAHVIIDNKYQHFIVIYKIDKKKQKLIIADPASSIKKISYLEFSKISSCNFLLLYPNKKIVFINNIPYLKQKIKTLLHKNIILISSLVLISIFFTILGIILSFQFQFLLDYIINRNLSANLFTFIILFGFFIIMREWFSILRKFILNYLNHILSKELIMDIYHHLLSLPYLYYKNRTTGEVVSRIQDLENIKEFIGRIFVTCFVDMFLLVISFFVLLKISNTLTVLLVFISIILFILIVVSIKVISTKLKKLREENALSNSYLIETISGIETIRGFGLEKHVENKFKSKFIRYQKTSYQTHKFFTIFEFIKNLIEEYGIFIILVFGSWLVMKEKLELSSLITYYFLISYFLEPIKNLFDIGFSWQDSKISLERINELYQITSETKNNKLTLDRINGEILVKDLSYQYNPKRKILSNINLTVKSKDRILIYGISGSGKSTLAKLLANIIKADSGSIILDNYPLEEYNASMLRDKVCYLSQNELLFQDSVYENIYLNSDRNYNDFLDICSLCMVDEIVANHPLKYEMMLEEDGFNISGGERQRIILARAILKDADLYILDESLNEIDIDRERVILKNIFEKYPDKTFIIISHRYHNNDLFNRKINMKDGKCYEVN